MRLVRLLTLTKEESDLTGLRSVRQPPLHSSLVQTLSDLRNLELRNFTLTKLLEKSENFKNNIFEKRAEFFLARMKAQKDSDAGGILLGENTGGGRSCCGLSCSTVFEFGFQLDSYIYPVCVHSISAGPLGTYSLLLRHKPGSVFIPGDERRT